MTARSRDRGSPLARWYEREGRHDLPWRSTRDRWAVLVSEVMLQQTQVTRVLVAWPAFMARFPTPAAAAGAGPGAVIEAWGRLGYPRRARRLWEAAALVSRGAWPDDLTSLPGVGRYTAAAVHAQVDDADVPAVEVNVRRVLERAEGQRLTPAAAETAMVRVGARIRGRDRLLALMDVGALLCAPRAPRCGECPLRRLCATRGPLADEARPSQARFQGSFRQRRGQVLERLRRGRPVSVVELDRRALTSLVADGLAAVRHGVATLP